MDKTEAAIEIRKYFDDFRSEVVAYYEQGDSARGQIEFGRWRERMHKFLETNIPSEVEHFAAATRERSGGVNFHESVLSIFMRSKGRYVIGYLESLISSIEKDRISFELAPIAPAALALKIYKVIPDKYLDAEPEIDTIFIDIVSFSNRKHKERLELIKRMNDIVLGIVNDTPFSDEEGCILIPTGDGMAISLKSDKATLSISISSKLKDLFIKYNVPVRIGINKSRDTLVKDINNSINLCGPGIIGAQRIMDFGNAHQILISESIYQTVKERFEDHYFSDKKELRDKHNNCWAYYEYRG